MLICFKPGGENFTIISGRLQIIWQIADYLADGRLSGRWQIADYLVDGRWQIIWQMADCKD